MTLRTDRLCDSACQSCVSVDGHWTVSQGDYEWRDNPDNAIVALFSASLVSVLPNFNKATFLTFATV